MALQLGDTAPDFTAETNRRPDQLHDWIGDSLAALLASADFTPSAPRSLATWRRSSLSSTGGTSR